METGPTSCSENPDVYACSACGTEFDMLSLPSRPFVLACGNIICFNCAEKNSKQQYTPDGSFVKISCPKCNNVTSLVKQARTDIPKTLLNYIEGDMGDKYNELLKSRAAQDQPHKRVEVEKVQESHDGFDGLITTSLAPKKTIPQMPVLGDGESSDEEVDVSPLPPPDLPSVPPPLLPDVFAQPPLPSESSDPSLMTDAPPPPIPDDDEPAGFSFLPSAEAKSEDIPCSKHQNSCTHFCINDRRPVCSLCSRECTEKKHKIVPLQSSQGEILKLIKDSIPELRKHQQTAAIYEGNISTYLSNCQRNVSAAEVEIVRAMSAIRAVVDELQHALLQSVGVGASMSKLLLMQQRERVQTFQEDFTNITSMCNSVLQQPPDQLSGLWKALSSVNDLLKSATTTEEELKTYCTEPTFELVSRDPQELRPAIKSSATLVVSSFPIPSLEIPDVFPEFLLLNISLESPLLEFGRFRNYSFQFEIETETHAASDVSSGNKSLSKTSEVVSTPYSLVRLEKGLQYSFRVRAINQKTNSAGPWSTPMVANTPPSKMEQKEADEKFRSGYNASEKSVDLSGKELATLPQQLFLSKPEDILSMRFDRNNIRYIPKAITMLQELRSISLAENKILAIPQSISGLQKLQELNLNDNDIEVLPESICLLSSLRRLSLRNNRLTEIPDGIWSLPQIQSISVAKNRIEHLPDCLNLSETITSLDVSTNELTTLPTNIGLFVNLKEFAAANNKLQTIPDSLVQARKIEVLDFSGNKLHSISWFFKEFTSLWKIDLSRNDIYILPESIVNIRSLRWFSIAENNIDEIPEQVKELSSLEFLDVSENERLSKVPEPVFLLPKLEEMHVGKSEKLRPFIGRTLPTGKQVLQ